MMLIDHVSTLASMTSAVPIRGLETTAKIAVLQSRTDVSSKCEGVGGISD